MIGVHVTVPVACFRKGLSREYLETEALPPPSTCYGFLLSLAGETNRERHVGARVAPVLLRKARRSVVLRTVWRIKSKEEAAGVSGNKRPDLQELLTEVDLVIWADSSGEVHASPTLEERVQEALDPATRHRLRRFGGLSLGESTHLVDTVTLLTGERAAQLAVRLKESGHVPHLYQLDEQGSIGMPVWVDHVGSLGTRYVVGSLKPTPELVPPQRETMPVIEPPTGRRA